MTLKRKKGTQIEFKGVQRASFQAVIELELTREIIRHLNNLMQVYN